MNKIFFVIIVILITPPHARAETLGEPLRSPADMTVAERMEMLKTASKYDNCIYSQAISRADDFSDIRHAADFAMGVCRDKLGDLENSIKTMGFGPDFALAFTNHIRNRAARKILPELAIRKSGG
ncbi:MAG: hypothetical protein E2O36_06935 [Proteobacteria bacterium]|nr:MAG: hypothetical protein E2O36_06935 [Pseudomonadota bacterium]TDJ69538.1 MAG: hypothetical protein E2O35_01150 [Pseudomonadota bacterium]